MGRHAAPPPSRSSSRARSNPGRTTSTATAGFLVAGAGAALAVATLVGIAAAGIDLAPRPPAAAAASPTPAPTVPRVALSASPAQAAVLATLGPAPAAGWVTASGLSWTGGTPFDATCGRPAADAALSGTRIYGVGKRQLVATVSAYSAGTGAVAFDQWAQLLGRCAGPVSRTATSIGAAGSGARTAAAASAADAFVAWIRATDGRPAASALFWRRGDMIAVLATPSASPDGLASAAISLDRVLVGALAGRCADVSSTVADAARTPWVAGDGFTGLTAPITVTVAPSPIPSPPPGVAAVAPTWTPSPLPSPSFPVRPADPLWPTDLPTPVVSPTAPLAPAPAPTLSIVPSREPDPTGPGCGWAFTGQVEPPFDAAREQALADARIAQAQDDLAGQQALYVADVVTYWQQVPVYDAEASAFAAYVAQVRTVAEAWDRIQQERDDYDRALADYNATLQTRTVLLQQQEQAQAAYDAAVAACATASPTPAPTDATPTPTAPTATPSPTPTVGGCPPPRPPILDAPVPTLPPMPSPPPDPRPS